MTEKRTPKRRLSKFDFSKEGAHLALVHKEQGGAANGYSTLIMKSAANFSEDFIQKVQQVRVTLELDDFLSKFFGLWEQDAKVLAAMFGYKEEAEGEGEPTGVYSDDSFYEWYRDKCEKAGTVGEYGDLPQPKDSDYQDWIASRLEGIEILKSLNSAESIPDFLSTLTEDEYLSVLRSQEQVEKALIEKACNEPTKKPKAAAKKPKAKGDIVAKAVTADPEVDKTMTKVVEGAKPEPTEMIEKSQFEVLQKAQELMREELQKAKDLIDSFKAKEKEQITKARKEQLTAAVEVEEHVETLFKAVGELEDEAFDAVVGVLKSVAHKVDVDPLFVEQGSPAEGEKVQKSALRAKLEAKYTQ